MCVQRWWSEYHLARELDGTFDFNASPEGFCRGPAGCSRPSANSGDGALAGSPEDAPRSGDTQLKAFKRFRWGLDTLQGGLYSTPAD